ncbi:hypothetical protein FISHEDRAFT_59718 [Fistulina hepatica ATCC 64428]|uniref:Uncharacterized protein n=1 Tax=Fistulina hepatica ATCC 64428 TaxID=1128425 RepID=A0A0D7AAC4_9AGAR|nr:hypothetical protein FISHEDRAFT_59718 [Fistulina hepatica ATCC 64428]
MARSEPLCCGNELQQDWDTLRVGEEEGYGTCFAPAEFCYKTEYDEVDGVFSAASAAWAIRVNCFAYAVKVILERCTEMGARRLFVDLLDRPPLSGLAPVIDHDENGRRDLLQLNVAGLLNIALAKRDQAPFSIPKFYRPFATARRREKVHSILGVVNIKEDDEVLGSLLYDGSSKTMSVSTQNLTVIYLVQVLNNTSYTTDDGSHDSDVKIVRMVLRGADPADTVHHCMSEHMSQFFAFNETDGKLSPMWFKAEPVQPAAHQAGSA